MTPKAVAIGSLVLGLLGMGAMLGAEEGRNPPWFATGAMGVSITGFVGLLIFLLVRRLAQPDGGEFGLYWWLRHTGLVVLCGCLLIGSCLSCMVGTVSIMGTPPDDAQGRPMKRSDSSGYFFFGGTSVSAALFGAFLWVRRKADWS